MSNLLAMTVTGSVIVGLMLLLRPVTAKIFPARWQYRIGKMAIAFFLVPITLFVEKFSFLLPETITPSQYAGTSPMSIPEKVQLNGMVEALDSLIGRHYPMTMEKYFPVEVMQIILFVWFVGAIVFAAWHFYCYHRFIKQIRADSIPVSEDTSTAVLFSSCKAALGIHHKVKLMQHPKITSPMLAGLHHPMVLLPTLNMQEIDLKLVLTHELTHLKRKDLWVKMFALAAGMLHWFNPFVYILRKDIGRWSDLSCDEVLAIEMSHEERRLYGEAILNTLDIHSRINTAFCSSLCESKKYIERRLTMLLNVKKVKKHIAIFAVAAILAIGGTGIVFAAASAEVVDDNTVNATVEKTETQLGINVDRELTKSKKTINVDIKSLKSGQFVCLGEYTLEEGDLIAYNLTAEGDGNINVGFYKAGDTSNSNGYWGYMMYAGNCIIDKKFHMKVNRKLAGTYYLWVGNFEGETLNNIKGSVEIAEYSQDNN